MNAHISSEEGGLLTLLALAAVIFRGKKRHNPGLSEAVLCNLLCITMELNKKQQR